MSQNTLQFKIATPDRVVYSDIISHVTIPTQSGEITVYPNHTTMVSVVKPGEIRIVKDGQTIPLATDKGVLEIRDDNTVVILADYSENAEEIDIDAAQAAYDRAEAYLKEKDNVADVDFARMQAVLERELTRVNVGKKWRK